MNMLVKFPIAKLLKEKEFDLKVKQRWCIVENIDGDKSPFCQHDCGVFNWNNEKYADYISAPTIAEVVMWLYDKHDIWIQPMIYRRNPNDFIGSIYYNTNDNYLTEPYKSPTQAYEAAIEYVLKNLI